MSTISTVTTLSNQVSSRGTRETLLDGAGKELLRENIERANAGTADVYNSEANLAQDRRDGTFSVISSSATATPGRKSTELQNVISSSEDEIFRTQNQISRLSNQAANAMFMADRAQTEMMSAQMNEESARNAWEMQRASTRPNSWNMMMNEDMMNRSMMRGKESMERWSMAMMTENMANTMMETAQGQMQSAILAKQSAEIELLG